MSDPVVVLNNGIPVSGSGTITTLGLTLVDGANATHGSTTDAAVTAGASGTHSAKLRAISRDTGSLDTNHGTSTDAAVTAGATGTISAKLRSISRDIGSLVTGTVLAAGSAIIGLVKLSDGTNTATIKAASTAPVATDTALVVTISPNSVNANGQNTMANSAPVVLPSNQSWPTGMSPRGFEAVFTTLTRPANTTAYSALDSISNNATAGSVTALSATVSDTNDDPITITELLVSSTDTGLAGKRLRAYLYNSDPTASTGVGAGDNSAFANKKAGYIGSLSGLMESGFSDGTVGRLVPTYADGSSSPTPHAPAGGFIVTKPVSGAKTLYVQYQAVDVFTPSANSTTIIGTVRGFQGRAS